MCVNKSDHFFIVNNPNFFWTLEIFVVLLLLQKTAEGEIIMEAGKNEMTTGIDDLMWAIYFYQIQDGGDISNLGAEVYNKLVTEFGGDPEHDHLTPDNIRVYNYASEQWYAIGFNMAMKIKELIV